MLPCSRVPAKRAAQPRQLNRKSYYRTVMPSNATARIPRIVLSCLFSALCLLLMPAAARTARQPFSATISVENPGVQTGPYAYTVKTGSDLFIKVHLTNISRRKISLGYDKDSRTNVDFCHQYDVRDSHGNLVLKRPIDHPEIGSTLHGWPARILKPGESMDITGDFISRLYDLSQPGAYTIQLSRSVSGDPKDGAVKSNTITVTVTE